MSEHTKEPWAAYQDGKREQNNIAHFIKSAAGDLVTYGHLSEADARRIVACVNALAGIPTDFIEAANSMFGVGHFYRTQVRVEKQRDEALAELKKLNDLFNSGDWPACAARRRENDAALHGSREGRGGLAGVYQIHGV